MVLQNAGGMCFHYRRQGVTAATAPASGSRKDPGDNVVVLAREMIKETSEIDKRIGPA